MVQSEGDQYAFDKSVHQRSHIPRVAHKVAESVDSGLDIRPDEKHQHADGGVGDGGDYRNEPRAAEKRYDTRQADLVEAIVQRRNAESYDDTAENAHFKRGYTDDIRHRPLGKRAVADPSGQLKQRMDSLMHYEKGYCRRKRCGGFFVFRHSERNAHCKKNGQVVKNDRTDRGKHRKHRPEHRAGSKYRLKVICRYHSGIGQRRAYAEQKPRDR